jgi:hypothetical protein
MRTDFNSDNGVYALRTTWNDTGCANPGDIKYYQQMYYTVRAVNTAGMVSQTSRTVGKWTRTFEEGVSTFSLPLEPLDTVLNNADFYLNDMNARYIKWMNPSTNVWMKHGDGDVNDADLDVGSGYEVAFDLETDYTFCGMPASMIKWDNGSFTGYDWNSDARSLSASFDPGTGDITLNWDRPAGMSVGVDFYNIYYSNTRDGFWGILGIDYQILSGGAVFVGTETAVHANAALPGTHLYYMIVPTLLNGRQIGASSYSIGVWTEEYNIGYDTMGIPLVLSTDETADWWCDNINDVVGINYLFNSTTGAWGWHSQRMPQGAFDPILVMAEGYQVSTSSSTKYSFVGI